MPYKSMSFRGRTLLFYAWLTVLITASLTSTAQFRQVYEDPFDKENEVRGMHFISPSTGYVAFKNKVGFTSDSAHHFIWRNVFPGNVDFAGNPVNLLFGFNQNGVKAINQQTILLYGEYGLENTILRSTDGGNTYRVVFYRPLTSMNSNGITDISLVPGSTVAFAVDQDLILRSSNSGSSWSVVFSGANSFFNHVQAVDNNFVIAYSGGEGSNSTHKLYTSITSGASWQAVTLPAGNLYSAYFLTATRGWVSMSSGLYLTTNGGASWVRQDKPETPFIASGLYFADEQTGYALSGFVYKTTNGGQYWEPLNNQPALPEDRRFTTLLGYSGTQLWTGGTANQVQLTTNGGGTPRPNIYFAVDTTGFMKTRKLQLVNHSKTSYTFQWFRNDTLIGNTYNLVTDGRGHPFIDTFKLVASNGTYTSSASQLINYTEPASLSSFEPAAAPTGGMVTIRGNRLSNITGVYFGGVPAASVRSIDYNTLTAVVGAGASGDITVATLYNGTASIAGFVYLPPPVITSITPAAVAAGSTITITGNHFTSVTEVRIGGIRVTNYTVVSPTTITVPAPSGPSGNIEVKTSSGSTSIAGYTALPGIRAFAPNAAVVGSQLRISGSSLLEVTGITIGGVPVTSFTIHSADSITARIGNGATGSVVVNSGGGSASKPGFTLLEPPVITAFAPQSGAVGSTVTITGSHFDPVAANNIVLFGTARATVNSASTTSLTVTVPGGAIHERISVTTRSLTAFSSTPYKALFTVEGTITPSSFAHYPVLGLHQYVREYMVQGVGDLDGDGKQDIITSNNYMGSSLYFARNTGDGKKVSFEEVDGNLGFATAIATGDLNGDGKPEIVIDWSGNLSVWPNFSTPGTISFAHGVALGGPASEAYANVTIIDIDKDGKPDIVKGATGHILVYRNLGEPGIFAFDTIDIPSNGIDAMAYDMNGDGLADIVQYDRTGNNITLHRNTSTKGSVSFAAPVSITADSPMAIAIGDIDNDGKPDIAIASANNGKMQLFRNTSQGTSLSVSNPQEVTIAANLYDVSLADLDGDGLADLVASSDKYQFTSLINQSTPGNISFDEPAHHAPDDYVFRSYRFMVNTGDFNSDGRPDFLLVSKNTAQLDLFINQAKGQPHIDSWTPREGAIQGHTVTIKGKLFTGTTAVSFGGVPAASFTIVDDNTIQAVLGAGASGLLSITNAGGTTEKPGFLYGATPVITGIAPLNGPVGSQVVINGSGFDPVAAKNTVYFGGIRASVLTSTGSTLTITVPAGTITPGSITVTSNNRTAVSNLSFAVTFPSDNREITEASFTLLYGTPAFVGVAADFDLDGQNDLVGSASNALFAIAKNTSTIGNISFDPAISFGQGEEGSAYAAGDLDGDGRIDLVVTSKTSNLFHVFRNTSTGNQLSFARDSSYSIFEGPVKNGVTIADLDQDGIPEIVGFTLDSRRVFVFRNYSTPGKTAFAPREQFYAGGDPLAITSADLDNDGKQEILVKVSYMYSNDYGYIALGNTGQNNTINLESKGGVGYFYAHNYSFGDYDGDGLLDAAGTSQFYPNLTVGRNISTNNGRVTFAAMVGPIIINQEHGSGLTTADVNGDGKPELFLTTTSGLSLFNNTSSPGAISLEPRKVLNIMGAFGDYFPMDVDGDGAIDLVAGGSIMRNNMNSKVPSEVLLCAGTDTTLQANLAATTYQWQQDAGTGFTNINDDTHFKGTTTAKLELTAIPATWNGYQFRCVDNNGNPGKVFILKITSGTSIASVTIATPVLEVCQGAHVAFTATPVNGGNTPTYQWLVNGQTTGITTSTFNTTILASGDEVSLTMISNAGCTSPAPVSSNVIKMIVHEYLVPAVTLSIDPTTGCNGTPAKFIATPVNGGLAPNYTWVRNGNAWPDYENGSMTWPLVQGDVIQVVMYGSSTCATQNQTFSNILTIGGNTPGDPQMPLSAAVSITASATSVCTGETVTFQATPVHGGTTPAYQWQVNGANAGNNSATFTSNQLKAGDVISVLLTSSEACTTAPTVTSNAITLTAGNGGTTPTVSITSSKNNICAGTEVTFTATPANGGSTPTYQWQVNGVNVGTNSAIYTASNLADGAQVKVLLTSNAPCAPATPVSSNAVTMVVMNASAATAIISGNTTVAASTATQLSATISRSGTSTTYHWQDSTGSQGWQTITGATTATINYTPQETGDKIRCIVTTNAACMINTAVTSNVLAFVVNTQNGGRIAPNPVANVLNIGELSLDDQWVTAEIASVSSGNRLIVQGVAGQTTVSIPVAKLTKGLYVVLLRSKTGATKRIRFIKQ